MIRYSLSKLGKRPKGSTVVLPPLSARLGTEKAYYAALRAMLAGMASEVRDSVIEAYRADMGQQRAIPSLTGDAAGKAWFERLNNLAAALARVATDTVNRILGLEAQRHTTEFMATAKKALGIDLRAVVTQEDLAEYMRLAADRNASLITSLSDDIVKRVERVTYENYVAGNSVKTLREQLQKQLGIGDNRARLIARDQTAKLNSDLNKIRQQQAGVTSYSWMTSHDERVRARHKKLDGNVYKWGEPTGAEDGLPPGQPIQCRCIARGVVEF